MTIPSWIADAVFYQIFPDRFSNGDPSNDPSHVQPWGSAPTIWGYQGGDLRGVIQHFDYLLDLGVNAVYFNPIFKANSNHRYNITDYLQIDPILGTMDDFRALLDLAHRNHIHIILDGVFNHCGRGFFAFQDLLENEEHSPYMKWFHVHRFPLDACGQGKAQNYAAWWGFKSLPKFNTDHPAVRKYLLDVARYWIEQGADGWRLDVPNEISDDSFWAEFRRVVKETNPEAYLVGEIWEADPRWVGEGHFDGLMNYPLREAAIRFAVEKKMSASQFAARLESLLNLYPWEHDLAHMLPVGSHDTERILTICNGDLKRVRLMNLIQFCFPGAPHVYYGDEIGMAGGKDPACRGAFPWDEQQWDHEQRTFMQTLITLRYRLPPLRRGNFRRVFEEDDQGVVVFSRSLEDQTAILMLNSSEKTIQLALKQRDLGFSEGQTLSNALSGKEIAVSEGYIDIRLPALEGVILTNCRLS
jgi:cyclomaltodextrinase